MPTGIEFNLQDLANIALGAPELTQVNIAILHSLIEILLKKLDCHNETVSLNEFEGRSLEKILETAKISPLPFNDENVELVSQKLERLEKLEKSVNNLNEKLDKHLLEVQRPSNFEETVFNAENWSHYGCEDLCTTCDPENEMACTLLKNTDFLKKLLRRISAPMVDRMFYFEEKIQKLNEEFDAFAKRAEDLYFKIHLLEKCIVEIENLRQQIQDQNIQFLNAMEEIQDLLDTKLDKIHMPALKKYIRDNFLRIDKAINLLQHKRQCPRAAGIVMENLHCVSCGYNKVCSEVGVQPTSMLPDMKSKTKKPTKICRSLEAYREAYKCLSKTPVKSWNLGDQITIKRPKIIHHEEEDDDKEENKNQIPKCRKAGEDFDLLEGFDGNLYRKG